MESQAAEFIVEPKEKYDEIRCYIRDPDGYIYRGRTEHWPRVRLTLARLLGQVGVTSGSVTAFPLDGGTRDGLENGWCSLRCRVAVIWNKYAILLIRVSIGLFCAISGANKLFVAGGTKPVYDTLVKAKAQPAWLY
jgi:hypothetical protein